MSNLRSVSLLCGAICLLGLCGCDASPAGEGDEQEVTSVKQGLVSYWRPYHGGPFGDEFNTQDAYGIDKSMSYARMQCGYYVDQMHLQGDQHVWYGPYGGSGGSPKGLNCNGKFVGVKGKAGSWIDQLTFVCRGADGLTYDSETCGESTGGEYFEEICDSTKLMVAVKGRHSQWGLEGIQIGCGVSDPTH